MTTTYKPGPRRALVLQMTKDGKTPREISRTLDLSTTTVYEHIRALRERGLLKGKR